MSLRQDLINSLIREGYLKNPFIIEAFRAIDRADFVPDESKTEAYANYPLSIGNQQTISQPLTVAIMLEALDPRPGEKILDIGSGSGWTTALLAHVVGNNGKVYAVEVIPELCKRGKSNLQKYNFVEKGIVIFTCKDGNEGLAQYAPYDKILASAAASKEIPRQWKDQLKVDGKIVAPIENSIWIFTKKSEHEWGEEELPGFAFVPLTATRQRTKDERRINSQNQKNETGEMKKGKKLFFLMSLILSLLALGLVYEIYLPHPLHAGTTTIVITPGLGSRKIGELLRQKGVIQSKWAFVTYVSLTGTASQLKPGTYIFTETTIPEIARDLIEGANREVAITIPEGWNTRDIADYLEQQKIMLAKNFMQATHDTLGEKFNKGFSFLNDRPGKLGLEGYLFPDTYRIYRTASAEEIIQKMLQNFGKKLSSDLQKEIKNQDKTIFEIITMASLIEKEVATDEDRALVSGILWKRIAKDIPLQVDATIAYITGKNTTKILVAETKIDSPYNTYKYKGLPKGPIANPGIAAIKAAIYPTDSPYLYYLSTPEGKTVFSKTLEEHNAAKAKYLK